MSLDVYLDIEEKKSKQKIFIRENGQNKEITREEWDLRFPGKEPVTAEIEDNGWVYSANITHNLTIMANKANIYEALWRPDENGYKQAKDLILRLEHGLRNLRSNPEYFKQFNPENGWGTYEGLIDFVEKYLEACKKWPNAKVSVWR